MKKLFCAMALLLAWAVSAQAADSDELGRLI